MGDVISVYGEVDFDGFYRGELDGRRGLVPSNFLRTAPPPDDRRPAGPRHHHSSRYSTPSAAPGPPLSAASPPPLAVADPRDVANNMDGSMARPLQVAPISRCTEMEMGQPQRSPLPQPVMAEMQNIGEDRSMGQPGERFFSGGNEQQPPQQMRSKHRRT